MVIHDLFLIIFQLKIEKSVFIQGKTGSGKSTLLKLIMNQLQPTKGEIVINWNQSTRT